MGNKNAVGRHTSITGSSYHMDYDGTRTDYDRRGQLVSKTDKNGRKTYYDSNYNEISQADKNAETLFGIAAVVYILAGVLLGLILSDKLAWMTTVQGLLVIWVVAIGLIAHPTYLYFQKESWVRKKMLKDKEDLAYWAGLIAGFALLVTMGWVLGDSQQGTVAQSASMNLDGSKILVAVIVLAVAITLSFVAPWVVVPILVVLVLGMISEW